jgi:hypothetical protein
MGIVLPLVRVTFIEPKIMDMKYIRQPFLSFFRM